jgi:hypothetical protein
MAEVGERTVVEDRIAEEGQHPGEIAPAPGPGHPVGEDGDDAGQPVADPYVDGVGQ